MVAGTIRKDNLCGQMIERQVEDQPGDLAPCVAAEVTAHAAMVDRPTVILARHRIIGARAVLPARMATDVRCLDREPDLANAPGDDCVVNTTLLPSSKPLIMWVFLARLDLHYSQYGFGDH
jgi:hypothetical protein